MPARATGPEGLVLVFRDGVQTSFVRSDRVSASWFGGPGHGDVRGAGAHSRRLHHVATIREAGPSMRSIPLLYGLCFDGCRLRYGFDGHDVRVTSIQPRRPLAGWPYRDYPALLPYVPLSVARRTKTTWRKFVAAAPNLPDEQPADLVALVPPPATLGMSLWGTGGDFEGVTIVFECDLTARTVDAYNVCS